METIPNQVTPAPKKSLGSVIAIIIIIVLVVIGGLYIWGKQIITEATLPPVSSSDEVKSIAEDASTNLDATVNVDISDLEATLK